MKSIKIITLEQGWYYYFSEKKGISMNERKILSKISKLNDSLEYISIYDITMVS